MVGLLHTVMLQSILMGSCFSSDSESREECEIKEVNGFLMNVCETPAYVPEQYLNFRIRIKCINSEEFYNVSWKTYGRIKYMTVDDLCSTSIAAKTTPFCDIHFLLFFCAFSCHF